MTIRIVPLTEALSVAGQIEPSDLTSIADSGFKTLICNRPDGEGEEQPLNKELAILAKQLGMTFIEQPVTSGAITKADIAQFADILHTAQTPILAFCRTGTRCSTLWVEASNDLGSRAARRDTATSLGFSIPS
ncbi:TIGR01244 family sulfur transferase [Vibrio palustris]|uniref:Beta-lactamase hydrolase-like protein n=1 Tax=Vibrio palustris TaxID=1918946 RepID=A0A1R4B1N6_9VIBR|nr:TIGR01244 family sulfur transferase [Vibrio palustris]SJL82834.1 Beta-lactamase hydrolase-like protein [Vibrio palustris]